VTDGLGSYASAFDQTFAKNQTHHIRKPRFIDKANNNMVERLHGTIKERTKTMRGLDDSESARNVVDGLRLAYNFIRPHSALNERTPTEARSAKSTGSKQMEESHSEQR
jgi:transposase-like protein